MLASGSDGQGGTYVGESGSCPVPLVMSVVGGRPCAAYQPLTRGGSVDGFQNKCGCRAFFLRFFCVFSACFPCFMF